jgi:predicted dehydrogenase
LHILLEKPMAPSLAECDGIIKEAEKKRRLVSVVAQNRYTTSAWNVKRLIADGSCGKLVYGHAYSVWWRGNEYYNTPWRGAWEHAGGGCVLNLGIHQLDLLLWNLGTLKETAAFMTNIRHPGAQVEDLAVASMVFENGSIGELTCSQIHHGENPKVVFQTEHAGVEIPFAVRCSRSGEGGFPEPDSQKQAEIEALYKGYPPLEREGHAGQITDFVRAIETDDPAGLPLTGSAGRNVIEAITGIYKSGATGKPVSFPIGPEDPFYTREGVLERMPRY